MHTILRVSEKNRESVSLEHELSNFSNPSLNKLVPSRLHVDSTPYISITVREESSTSQINTLIRVTIKTTVLVFWHPVLALSKKLDHGMCIFVYVYSTSLFAKMKNNNLHRSDFSLFGKRYIFVCVIWTTSFSKFERTYVYEHDEDALEKALFTGFRRTD